MVNANKANGAALGLSLIQSRSDDLFGCSKNDMIPQAQDIAFLMPHLSGPIEEWDVYIENPFHKRICNPLKEGPAP